jgi:hypothetical protein
VDNSRLRLGEGSGQTTDREGARSNSQHRAGNVSIDQLVHAQLPLESSTLALLGALVNLAGKHPTDQ